MEEWETLLSSKNYQVLLDKTNDILLSNPNSIEALIYKGRALVYLRKYKKVFNVFKKALTFSLSFKRRKKIKDVMISCNQIIQFKRNYENNCLEAEEYPKKWYEERLDNIAKECAECMPFNIFENQDTDAVFILGPMSRVNTI